jgi:hypothetical protein
MRVIILDEAKAEHKALPARERVAIQSAIEKLIAYGLQLGFSRSSAVRGIDDTLRELHPRAGRSPWWAFYRRSGEFIVNSFDRI